jgi:accessory colonization factor AcfC
MHATAMVLSRKGMPKKIRAFLDFFSERLNIDDRALR